MSMWILEIFRMSVDTSCHVLVYMTIVQDMEIVLGYSGYDFINETKDWHKKELT